jgi:hypothetical protein
VYVACLPRDLAQLERALIDLQRLEAMLPSGQGVFYARRIEGGWDIIGPVNTSD